MTKVLIVTGSARPKAANPKVVELVVEDIAARENVTPIVADLSELNLPFMDGDVPSQPDYEITNQNVQRWQSLVVAADAVVFVMPEYNHGLSALQKNAIDWLYKEWNDKPVALVAYGFYSGRHAVAQFEEIATVIKVKLDDRVAGLQFGEEIDFDGGAKDGGAAKTLIQSTIDGLVKDL